MTGQKSTLLMDYEHFFSQKSNNNIAFVGGSALFDPNFIPSKIFPQKQQSLMLQSTIFDAIEDNYSTNVNLYGLKGSGKNLIVNHFLRWFKQEQGVNSSPKISDEKSFSYQDENTKIIIKIDCEKKEMEQIFFEILNEIGKTTRFTVKLSELIKLNPGKLFNLFKMLIEKIQQPVILYLNHIEHLSSILMNKFYAFAKNTPHLHIITSINTGIQKYSFKQYEGMQHKIQMEKYNPSELRTITEERSVMAFKQQLEDDAIDLIVDYVSDFDVQVPGSCVNYLKEIYPYMKNDVQIHSNDLRGISQFYFDSFHLDSMTLADFIVDTSIEERLFLEYVINYFQKKERFYIPFSEIQKAYRMTSEELGFIPQKREFYNSMKKITNIQLLRPSFQHTSSGVERMNGVFPIPHYLSIPLEEVNEILSFSFGMDE